MFFNQPTLTVDSMAHLTGLPDQLNGAIMEYFILDNPEYQEAIKRGQIVKNIPKKHKYFRIEKDSLVFPRGAIRTIIEFCRKCGVKLIIKDHRLIQPALVGLEFTGTLRSYQKKAADDILQHEFGTLEADTGSGKTCIAIYLIVQRAVPTIISVPTIELAHQWIASIKKFTNIKNIGLLGDGVTDIQPITVAIINSLSNHIDQLVDKFSFFIIDEAHRAATSTYINGPLDKLPTRYMNGLSATLFRNDGRDVVLHWYMGNTVHTVNSEKLREIEAVLKPDVYQRKTDFYFKNASTSYQKMISAMVENKERNNLIANEVIFDVQHKKHGVSLVVSDRVKHLEILKQIITQHVPKSRVFILTGRTKSETRKEIIEKINGDGAFILLSTTSLIKEGFDAPCLDSLHLTTPITFIGLIKQIVGRLLRPEDGKRPVIIDYIDDKIGLLEHRAKQRLDIFKKETYANVISAPPWMNSKTNQLSESFNLERIVALKETTKPKIIRQPQKRTPHQLSLFEIGVTA